MAKLGFHGTFPELCVDLCTLELKSDVHPDEYVDKARGSLVGAFPLNMQNLPAMFAVHHIRIMPGKAAGRAFVTDFGRPEDRLGHPQEQPNPDQHDEDESRRPAVSLKTMSPKPVVDSVDTVK